MLPLEPSQSMAALAYPILTPLLNNDREKEAEYDLGFTSPGFNLIGYKPATFVLFCFVTVKL